MQLHVFLNKLPPWNDVAIHEEQDFPPRAPNSMIQCRWLALAVLVYQEDFRCSTSLCALKHGWSGLVLRPVVDYDDLAGVTIRLLDQCRKDFSQRRLRVMSWNHQAELNVLLHV
jgi:hypothetical protein